MRLCKTPSFKRKGHKQHTRQSTCPGSLTRVDSSPHTPATPLVIAYLYSILLVPALSTVLALLHPHSIMSKSQQQRPWLHQLLARASVYYSNSHQTIRKLQSLAALMIKYSLPCLISAETSSNTLSVKYQKILQAQYCSDFSASVLHHVTWRQKQAFTSSILFRLCSQYMLMIWLPHFHVY